MSESSPSPAPTLAAMREALKGVKGSARLYVEIDGGKYLLGSHVAPLLVRDLNALIASALADSERLDWLERTIREQDEPAGIFLGWEDDEHVQFRLYRQRHDSDWKGEDDWHWQVLTNETCENGTGLRESIDAARLASGGES